MRKAPLFTLLLAVSGLAVAPALAARLVSQSVKGTKRQCVYEARPGVRPRVGDLQPAIEVGLGEPCPYHYPRPNNYRGANSPPRDPGRSGSGPRTDDLRLRL